MELQLFDEVGEAVRGLIPPELGSVRHRARRYGVKVWFGSDRPGREHYEAQVIGPSHVPEAKVLALEVGFHAEHPREADNEALLTRLRAAERRWRPDVGAEATAGPFLGRAGGWRRISETWPDPDLGEPGLAFEVAARLADYVVALEPLLRQTRTGRAPGRRGQDGG